MKHYIKGFKNLSLLTKYICFALFLHLISAYFSLGFYKDDEHFQILEPLAYLLGLNEILIGDTKGYYWEWGHRMRPWLQSYFYYHFVILLKFFGISNSFTWALAIRLFSSLIGFLSIVYLFLSIRKNFFKQDNHFNYLLFFSFWFYPFLHSRTSSENLSLALFIFAFCFLYKQIINEKYKFNYLQSFFFSLILGLSLVVRLNLIFTIFPIFIWVLIFKFDFKKILIITSGVLIALLAGLFVDYINYNGFYITYWNFFYHNIILGRMIAFGQQPWWYYLPTIAIELAPVLSVFFVISLIIFWFKKPTHVITWLTLLTLVIISFQGHKEIRYAFPIYIFAPLFISYFFETFDKIKFKNFFKSIIILSNFLFLIFTLFTPANGKVGVYNFLFKNNIINEKIYYFDENPYLINDIQPYFYTKFLPVINKLKKEEFDKIKNFKNIWIVTNNYEDYKYTLEDKSCKKLYNSFPEKIILLNRNWKKQRFNWYVIYCNKMI